MPAHSSKPFRTALRELMHERDISFRKLSYLTAPYRDRGPLSTAYINLVLQGEQQPTPETIEVIAKALGLEPTYFREYREHLALEEARRLIAEVGLDEVMEALATLRKAS